MKHRILRLLAYFYVPVTFLLLGIGIIAFVFYPFLGIGQTFANLLFSTVDVNAPAMGNATFTEPEITAPVNEEENAIDMANVAWPVDGDQYGRLLCPEIGLDTVVYWGDSYEILRKGPGTYKGGGIPGNGRTILIAGHNTMEFTCLQNVQNGDKITFKTNYGVYQYEITDIKILEYSDPTAFDLSKKEEELILYTCYPFTELGATTERCFVYGKRISGPDLVRGEEAKNEQ
ncbi:MAG: class D sortase [Oscillospiraceae bacterium]